MSRIGPHLAVVIAVLALSACAITPNPSVAPSRPPAFDFPVDCGPILDAALCEKAVDVVSTAKVNPPPIVAASVRRPRSDDDCINAFHPCGPEAVIVVIQSGDTLQEIPLVASRDGWIRLDLIR